MTVDQAKIAASKLGDEITALLASFEQATGCEVAAVRLSTAGEGYAPVADVEVRLRPAYEEPSGE